VLRARTCAKGKKTYCTAMLYASFSSSSCYFLLSTYKGKLLSNAASHASVFSYHYVQIADLSSCDIPCNLRDQPSEPYSKTVGHTTCVTPYRDCGTTKKDLNFTVLFDVDHRDSSMILRCYRRCPVNVCSVHCARYTCFSGMGLCT
jgi:hypothetical protein